jgi:rare lipoprotein A
MTAAHKTLPLPSYAKVTNLKNGRSVVVRVNDRGPFHENRIIDLSYAAAIKLGIHKTGTGFVEVRTVEPEENISKKHRQIKAKEKIFLQVGAFKQKTNALALKNKITALQNINYRIQQSTISNNQLVYKLQLGPIFSVNEADQLVQHLAKLGITNTHFITEKVARTAKHVTIAAE